MSRRTLLALAAAFVVGCAAGGPLSQGGSPATAQPPARSGRIDPLVLDRTDLAMGVTVQFDRLPNASEIGDLRQLDGLVHVVLALPAWPGESELDDMGLLAGVPPESDIIAILPGWPPSRAAADAWDALGSRTRVVVMVDGPPVRSSQVLDVNDMRAVERVVADMAVPSRSGFERLQRPLAFRTVR